MEKLTINKDRVIQMRKSGKTHSEIASEIGVSKSVITKRFREWNLPKGRLGGIVNPDEIVNLYLSGVSVNALSKKYPIGRRGIDSLLRKEGVKMRSQSESELIKWQNMTEEQKKRQVEKAHKAVKRLPDSHWDRVMRLNAKCKENTLSKVGHLETEFIQQFKKLGFEPVSQKAVDRYNIDIAINTTAVEIHINGANPHNAVSYKRRIINLLKLGWNVIYVKITSDVFIEITANKIGRMIHLIESNPSSVCQYGMIRGTSEIVTSGCLDGNDLSTVSASNGFFATIE